MWLETITVQTHHSKKGALEFIFEEMKKSALFEHTHLNAYYHQNAVLHITVHLEHSHIDNPNGSAQAAMLTDLLSDMGSVSQKVWQPLTLSTPR